jgi:hypothetical protein
MSSILPDIGEKSIASFHEKAAADLEILVSVHGAASCLARPDRRQGPVSDGKTG